MTIYQALSSSSSNDNLYMFCANPISWILDRQLGHFKRDDQTLVDCFKGVKIYEINRH